MRSKTYNSSDIPSSVNDIETAVTNMGGAWVIYLERIGLFGFVVTIHSGSYDNYCQTYRVGASCPHVPDCIVTTKTGHNSVDVFSH